MGKRIEENWAAIYEIEKKVQEETGDHLARFNADLFFMGKEGRQLALAVKYRKRKGKERQGKRFLPRGVLRCWYTQVIARLRGNHYLKKMPRLKGRTNYWINYVISKARLMPEQRFLIYSHIPQEQLEEQHGITEWPKNVECRVLSGDGRVISASLRHPEALRQAQSDTWTDTNGEWKYQPEAEDMKGRRYWLKDEGLEVGDFGERYFE